MTGPRPGPPGAANPLAAPERSERVEGLVGALSLDEKALLTAGADMWSTHPVPRLGVPSVRVTDGPNGARGPWLMGEPGVTSACIPCGSALGATWDPDLLAEVGRMLGDEARTKTCRVLLAPTVNIPRSPLAGRNFECYSEDPVLSGSAAAAFVRGVQSRGVATTVKHFAGNDAEFERMSMNSVIDERTLREIYLVPFEMAVRQGGSLGVMTGYNRLNGPFCSESARLLAGILRADWGFAGMVVTDWFARGSTVGSALAGTDLEMPGPGRFFGPALADAVRAGELDEAVVDARVRAVLSVFERTGALDDDPAPPRAEDRPEHRGTARRAATGSTVLLRNETPDGGGDPTLPLVTGTVRSVAVVGPNAARPQIMGGGSASVRPHYRRTPLEALRDRLGPEVTVTHQRGCDIDRATPLLAASALQGERAAGFSVDYFAGDLFGDEPPGEPLAQAHGADGQILFFGDAPDGVPPGAFSFRATARFTPAESGEHTFALVQAGRARLLVDGRTVLDGVTDPPPRGSAFFGAGSREITAAVALQAGDAVGLTLEFSGPDGALFRGVRVGHRLPRPDDLRRRAVAAAASADAAIVVVGTTDEWESEGRDRTTLSLPGDQDELVREVAAANRRTAVVVNAGSPVDMPWADEVGAIAQVWFGGQEMADALADVITGAADPAGRLPVTIPERLEHNPSYGNFPGENGELRYGEGLLVGYRWYEARRLPVRFPFGHGLSYTTFELGAPRLSSPTHRPGTELTVAVPVGNTGRRDGCEVVQCYVAPPAQATLFRPLKELRAFSKLQLAAGDAGEVTLVLGDRAFAYYDPGTTGPPPARPGVPGPPPDASGTRVPGWYVDPGTYQLHIGRSSAAISHVVAVTVPPPADGATAWRVDAA